MDVSLITTTQSANDEFYPTPKSLARKLFEGVRWFALSNVLEPSAGRGDLIRAFMEERRDYYASKGASVSSHEITMDTLEADPYLRSILKYELCGEKARELDTRKRELDKAAEQWDVETRQYIKLPPEQEQERAALTQELKLLSSQRTFIVGDDFLSFDSHKQYNLIIMNPPFSNGDEHLLKAIQLMKDAGGEIRCILNAETLRNPFSSKRVLLRQMLKEYEADIEYVTDAFLSPDSERKTDVEVALVIVKIPEKVYSSEIFDRLNKAVEQQEIQDADGSDVTDMTIRDFMSQIVTRFDVEVKAGIALIHEYKAMMPYILESFPGTDSVGRNGPILSLVVTGTGDRYSPGNLNVNEYIKRVRIKYWSALFSNKEFTGKLTSELRDKYSKMVDKLVDYDFTLFNIQTLAEQMQAEMGTSIQDTIIKLFDKMTQAHAWYPECEKNVHYFNGWATNKAHKINSKVILPCNGVYSDYGWSTGKMNVREAENLILDIERVFDYLDGQETEPIPDLHDRLENARKSDNTRNIPCKYFDVTFYKKGTMHIRFRYQGIVDKFNIYCCRHKNWLPPCYGRTKYQNMTREEQTVIDGFHGTGAKGSGEKEYSKVTSRPGYYLCEVNSPLLALTSGE